MFASVFFVSWVSVIATCNLICNGDFQTYSVRSTYRSEYRYEVHSSDNNCWYNKNGGGISIQTPLYMHITIGGELTKTSPYTLCQIVTLNVGEQYIFGYGLFCPQFYSNMLLTVTINSVNISTLFIATEKTIANKTFEFIANVSSNQFCFSEVHDVNSSYVGRNVVGGIIDNITLEVKPENSIEDNTTTYNQTQNQTNNEILNQHETQNTQFYDEVHDYDIYQQSQQMKREIIQVIHFKSIVEELLVRIRIVSDYVIDQLLLSLLKFQCYIKIQGQIQQQAQYLVGQDGTLQILIETLRKYDISTVQVSIKDFEINQFTYKFQVYLDNKKINFSLLSVEQISLITNLSPMTQDLSTFTSIACIGISSSLSSYFIISLFGFWNLSLMYNFLLISTFPSFARQVYEILMETVYQKNSLINWLILYAQIPEDVFQLKIQQKMTENVREFVKGFSWFGMFGFSSKVISNDVQIFLTALLLIIKLLLIALVMQTVLKSCKKKLGISLKYQIIFMYEIIATIPFITISSVTSLMSAVSIYEQKFSKIIQILLLLCCIMIILLWYLRKMSQISKSQKLQKKQINNLNMDNLKSNFFSDQRLQRIKRIQLRSISQEKKKQKVQVASQLQQFILYLTFPFMLITSNQFGFLLVHSICILARAVFFFKNILIIDKKTAFFQFLMTVIWIIHHFVFVTLYIFEQFLQLDIWTEQISFIIPKLAIVALFTVLLGGGIQLIKIVIDLIIGAFQVIVQIKNIYCKKSNKIVAAHKNKTEKKNKEEEKSKTAKPKAQQANNVDRILHFKFIRKNSLTKKEKKLKKAKKQKIICGQSLQMVTRGTRKKKEAQK